MEETSDKNGRSNCKEFNKCLEILHLMLDNEATEKQVNYLNDHLEKCMVCFEQYQVEKQIKELLRTKIKRQPVPADLAHSIRNKIFSKA